MFSECSDQATLGFHPDRDVRLRFDGGRMTTDAGLLPLRNFADQRSYYNRISSVINDPRREEKIEHEQEEILRQRGMGMVAGYEDANDCDSLAFDPAFVVINDGTDLTEDRGASQPTTSRMENAVSARSVARLNRWLLADWIEKKRQDPPENIVLEIDSTGDPAHGNQQLALYNGHYEKKIYLPLLIFDGNTGHCLCARLRRGNSSDKARAVPHLTRIVDRIREAFPEKRIQVSLRADAGFEGPDLYRALEEEMVMFAIKIRTNNVLREKTDPLLQQVKEEYRQQEGEKEVVRHTEFDHRAGSWDCKRRVCAKIEYGPDGAHRNFIVTHFYRKSPERVFSFYQKRGESENFIKEIKNGFSGDRLSCSSFLANAFRLLEYVLAYNLVNDFRNRRLARTELARADIHTLRVKLFKVAARIRTTVRNIWIELSEAWPFREHLLAACRTVVPRAG